jgi:hypothetical protein
MRFFVLVTNIIIGDEDIIKIYRKKDVIEKAFVYSK